MHLMFYSGSIRLTRPLGGLRRRTGLSNYPESATETLPENPRAPKVQTAFED